MYMTIHYKQFILFSLVGIVSGGGLVIGTQTPLEFCTYPIGHYFSVPRTLQAESFSSNAVYIEN